MDVEQQINREQSQQATASPSSARCLQEADSKDFFRSHALGYGAKRTKKSLESPSRSTLNKYHLNGSVNSSLNGDNSSTAQPTATTTRERKTIATAWDLPNLIRPLPVRRQPLQKNPRLLPHYPAVVEFIYNNRFAVAFQVQKKFPQYCHNLRAAQYQLANMVHTGYLNTAPVRSTSPNFPFVYFATKVGINLIRDTYAQLGMQWDAPATEGVKERGIGLESILHELLLTEWHQAVDSTVRNRPDLQCLFAERRYFRQEKRLKFRENGKLRQVVPDAGFVIQVSQADNPPILLPHYVEFDNGTMSLPRIAEKFEHYNLWAEAPEGHRYLVNLYRQFGITTEQPTFRLVVIAHANHHPGADERRVIDLFAQSLALPAPMRDRIWLTTAEKLRVHQNDELPLEAAIWLRPRDARSWLGEYQQEINSGAPTAAQKFALARRFVRERLDILPRHPLFPYGQK
jgi:hypothetical protein